MLLGMACSEVGGETKMGMGVGKGRSISPLARKPLLYSSSLLSVPLGGHSGPGQGSQGYLLCGEMHVGGSQR